MNPNNYVTRKVAKKLVDNGILLETEVAWFEDEYKRWFLEIDTDEAAFEYNRRLPAPSMAELWRVLQKINRSAFLAWDGNTTGAWQEWTTFDGYGEGTEVFKNENPADALAEFLIWIEKEKPCSICR